MIGADEREAETESETEVIHHHQSKHQVEMYQVPGGGKAIEVVQFRHLIV